MEPRSDQYRAWHGSFIALPALAGGAHIRVQRRHLQAGIRHDVTMIALGDGHVQMLIGMTSWLGSSASSRIRQRGARRLYIAIRIILFALLRHGPEQRRRTLVGQNLGAASRIAPSRQSGRRILQHDTFSA